MADEEFESSQTEDIADATVIGWSSRKRTPVWWLAAAGVFFLALWGWTELRLRAVQGETSEAHAVRSELEVLNRRLRLENEKLAAAADFLTSADTRAFALVAQKSVPSASGRAFIDGQGRARIYVHGLPKAPVDRIYHLWVLRTGSPRPQSVAAFDVDSAGGAALSTGNLPPAQECRTLFITSEASGEQPAVPGPSLLVARPL